MSMSFSDEGAGGRKGMGNWKRRETEKKRGDGPFRTGVLGESGS